MITEFKIFENLKEERNWCTILPLNISGEFLIKTHELNIDCDLYFNPGNENVVILIDKKYSNQFQNSEAGDDVKFLPASTFFPIYKQGSRTPLELDPNLIPISYGDLKIKIQAEKYNI